MKQLLCGFDYHNRTNFLTILTGNIMATLTKTSELSRNARKSMNTDAKGIMQALKTFKKIAANNREMQELAFALTGDRTAMLDMTISDILAAQSYPIYKGEVPTGRCAKKGRFGFEPKNLWTLNDILKAFERKYAKKPFKVEIVQELDIMVTANEIFLYEKAKYEAKEAAKAAKASK